MRVRAAARAGKYATALTSRSVRGNHERERKRRKRDGRCHADVVRDQRPRKPPDDHAGRYPQHDADDRQCRRFPRQRCADLTAFEADRLQHGEFVPAPACGGDQGVPDRDQCQHAHQDGEGRKEPRYVAHPFDLRRTCRAADGLGGQAGVPTLTDQERANAPYDVHPVAGRDARDHVTSRLVVVCGEHAGEPGPSNRRAVGQMLHVAVRHRREHGAADDAEFVCGLPTADSDGVPDVLVQRVHRVESERDLVVADRRAARHDRRFDRTAHLCESPNDGVAPVDVEVVVADRCDVRDARLSLEVEGLAVAVRRGTRVPGLHVPCPSVETGRVAEVAQRRGEHEDRRHAEHAEHRARERRA